MSPFNLEGKKGLIIGIANEQSLAYGCARAISDLGGQLAVTYLNDKAKPYVEPLANSLNTELFLPCNVNDEQQVQELFDAIGEKWGQLDFLIHSIAFAPLEDLHGKLIDSSKEGFSMAMDISCHSLIRLTNKAAPFMSNGGSIITMSYLGAERAIDHYNLMGPVKAALESSVRYLALELGESDIRVNAISAGAVSTRAASGLNGFDKLLNRSHELSPIHKELKADDVGTLSAFLVSDGSAAITGDTIFVDCGHHIME